MNLNVKCYAAPYENTTVFDDPDRAYDIAFNLAEEYQCDVDLYYYNDKGHRQCWATVSPS
jgi:hypothetical protein|tara:strand:+ start:22 stop:201 length:180 start_codon:yes stop_codon:yes gene_type:complete